MKIYIKREKFKNLIVIKLFILLQLLPSYIFSTKSSFASELNTKPTVNYLKNIPKNSFYILGSGDQLKISVSEEAKELDSIFFIDGEGLANLKRLKKVYVKGLTLKELEELLNSEYAKYVLKPNVKLEIISFRPITVYIDGEVESPGRYVIDGTFNFSNKYISEYQIREETNNFNYGKQSVDLPKSITSEISGSNQTNTSKPPFVFPTLIDVIRQSRGITANADLKEIVVSRKNNLTDGGGRLQTKINLLKVLNLEDTNQNIRILDGDTIFIPKGDNPSSIDIAKAIKSNINPSRIKVYIGGRVEMPGKYEINRTSSLNDAIEVSGGAKILKGSLRLIRYNNDGTVDKREFRYNRKAKRGSYKNPYLKNGDIVFIGKSSFNVASEVLNEVTSPLQSLVSIYGIYKVFD